MTHNFHLTEKPPTSQSGALRSQFSIALLLAISFASYVLLGVLQGRFAVTDEVVFKSAGRNWASTGSFSAPELPGFLQGLNQGPPVTEIYLAQPPGYTFLFGLFTRLVGFGPQQCILYDALIHILLAFTTGATALIVMKLPF